MGHSKNYLHPQFSINGKAYTYKALLVFSRKLVHSALTHEQAIGLFLLDWFSPIETIALTTSGTTGTPKKITVKKQAMVAHAKLSGAYFSFKPQDTILHLLPTQFIAGKMVVVRALTLGLDLWYKAPNKAPLKNVQRTFDWTSMVPYQLAHSLEHLDKVKNILIGGGVLPHTLKEKALAVAKNTHTHLFLSFGMTETLSHIAIAALEPLKPPLFKVLPGIAISTTAQGCLQVKAPYLEGAQIKTTDIVQLKGKQSFYWMGRENLQIHSGGLKLFPEQIEAQIAPHLKVPFFIVGQPDVDLGEQVTLVVEKPNLPVVFKALKTIVFTPPYFKPKSVLEVGCFKYSTTHKLKRKETLNSLYTMHPLR